MSYHTLGRFCAKWNAYELETGMKLMENTVVSLADEKARLVKNNPQLKRVNRLMVASNIKKMSRSELFYTCAANIVKKIDKYDW